MTLDRKVGMYWFYAHLCANFNIACNVWSIALQSTVQSVNIWYVYSLSQALSEGIKICPPFSKLDLDLTVRGQSSVNLDVDIAYF